MKPQIKKNLVSAMQSLVRNKQHDKGQMKVFQPLPNVRDFKIHLGKLDPLFLQYGIRKKYEPILNSVKYRNGSINRYIEHQLIRLRKQRHNPIVFWRIVEVCLYRSNAFFVVGLKHIFPNWHRTLPMKKVIALRRKYLDILYAKKIDFKRVYIPKKETYRPLGVPQPEWRIYFHLLNGFLLIWLERKLKKSQHAYIPGKGTLTAWIEIFEKVIDSPNIYEFDLKGFFPSVSIDHIKRILSNTGLPYWWVDKIHGFNQCQPVIPKDMKLTEDATIRMRNEFSKFTGFDFTKPPPFLNAVINAMAYKLNEASKTVTELYDRVKMYRPVGLPQGSPTSPLLSCLALHETIFTKKTPVVMYADDGLYYGKDLKLSDIKTSHLKMANIQFNTKKCGWVKKDGEWLKPLVFLGLQYDGNRDEFSAHTRKGSRLIMDKQSLILALALRDKELANDTSKNMTSAPDYVKFSWEHFIKSKVSGFIQSRLYSGSWNLDDFKQDFTLTYVKGSWCERNINKYDFDIDVFNSTSIASKSLMNILKFKYKSHKKQDFF